MNFFPALPSRPLIPFGGLSVSGRRWIWRDGDDAGARVSGAIAQRLQLPEMVTRLLAGRGLDADTAAQFLAPTLRAALPDPSVLLDMDRAAERLADAAMRGETVGVFGDYDVDGACAASLLATALRALGCTVATHIPDRMVEGYGPNLPALERLAAGGARLLVCVDCGTAAGEVLERLAGRAELIVLDHHKSDALPRGIVATVNPNRLDDRAGLGQLCAAGVVFLALVATHRCLRRRGFFAARAEPDLLALLDIVALATVCDVVPLTGVNRALVTQGLRVMARRARPGIAALLEVAGGREAPTAFSCGYALGPRINAGGRIGDAGLGVRLLLAEDAGEALAIARALDGVNRERQEVEAGMLAGAMAEADRQLGAGRNVAVLEGADWHAGVVGIVASRIKARFNRPVCVGARGPAITKGSGRSVAGHDLGAAVIAARAAGLLSAGGGHAMAAGYGHASGGSAPFADFLDERLAGAALLPSQPDLLVEGALAAGGATLDLAHAIARLAPFGCGNDEPVLALTHLRVQRADRLGAEGRVLRAILGGEGGARVKGMLFRAGDHPAASLLAEANGVPLHVAGHLRVDRWQGEETVCFAIEDAMVA